jgi:hypothetical protein
MTFILRIQTDNDAFSPEPSAELARILRREADRIEKLGAPVVFRSVHDINGNPVGEYAIKDAARDLKCWKCGTPPRYATHD